MIGTGKRRIPKVQNNNETPSLFSSPVGGWVFLFSATIIDGDAVLSDMSTLVDVQCVSFASCRFLFVVSLVFDAMPDGRSFSLRVFLQRSHWVD